MRDQERCKLEKADIHCDGSVPPYLELTRRCPGCAGVEKQRFTTQGHLWTLRWEFMRKTNR